ncbi:MAG: hypothetical protein WD768_04535 [Phycisphaeraceae bacterium]
MNSSTTQSDEAAARRLRTALDMHEFGVELMRQRLLREIGEDRPEEVKRRLRQWLREQPALPAEFFRERT